MDTVKTPESKRKANDKWDKEHMTVLGCKVKKAEAAAFKEYAAQRGKTSNAMLKDYVIDCITDKRPERPDSLATPGVQVAVAPKPDTPIKRDKAYLDDMKARRDAAHQDYLDGMKYKDIAEKHGVSLSAVKSWVVREWKKCP